MQKSYIRFWVLKLHFTTWGFKAFDQNKMFLVIRPDNSLKMKIYTPATLWSCGLICHVLDRKVEGSNLNAANFLFDQNLFAEVRAEEKEITSHRIGAVVVGEEEKMRKTETSFEASILSVRCQLTIFCNINSC